MPFGISSFFLNLVIYLSKFNFARSRSQSTKEGKFVLFSWTVGYLPNDLPGFLPPTPTLCPLVPFPLPHTLSLREVPPPQDCSGNLETLCFSSSFSVATSALGITLSLLLWFRKGRKATMISYHFCICPSSG